MRALRAAVATVIAAGTVGITGPASSGAAGHDIVYLATLGEDPATSGYIAIEGATDSTTEVRINREQHGTQQGTVDYTTIATGSATEGSDFGATVGSATLSPFDRFPVEVPILADGTEETVESFDFELSNPRGAAGMILATPRRASVTIVDDDGPARISFAVADYSLFEQTDAELVVVRQGAISGTASVQLDTTDGTATSPGDYTGDSETVMFPATGPGRRVQRMTIPIADDNVDEDPETFSATLSGESGAALVSPSTVVVEILDNDSQSSDRTEPVSTFHLPRNGKTYGPNSTPAKEAHISPSDEGSGVADVFFALRKNLRNGKCQWWRGNRFRQSSCSRRKWVDLRYRQVCFDPNKPFCIYQFGRRLPLTTRKTGIRSYTAWARAIDRAGNIEDNFEVGRNKSTFRIKP